MKLNKHLLIKAGIFLVSIYIIRLLLGIFIQPLSIYQLTVLPSTFFPVFKGEILRVLIFITFAFILYSRKELANLKNYGSNFKSIIGFSALTLASIFVYYLIRYFIKLNLSYFTLHKLQATILVTIPLIFFILFLFLAIFNYKFTKQLITKFKYQLISFSILGVLYFFLIRAFQGLWYYFSGIVATLSHKLFSLFYDTKLTFLADRTPYLRIENFKVLIGAPCSGIDSMLLFTTLYFLIFFLDYKKLNKKTMLLLFPIGLLGMFLFNVLRIFLLLLMGLYISPEFAVGLFHQNIGWLLFIIYFIIFYLITRKIIYKNSTSKNK